MAKALPAFRKRSGAWQRSLTPGFEIRRRYFPDVMEFYAPGLKRWETPEWKPNNPKRFLPVSVTGRACALQCDHCKSKVLEGMIPLSAGERLFELARRLRNQGSEGLLVSGGPYAVAASLFCLTCTTSRASARS